MPAEERQVPPAQEDAHGAFEAPPGRDGRQGLDVGALDLPRQLADLPLTDDRAGVGAEGHAAAAARLEVDNSQADVVRVRQDLDLQVDVICRGRAEEVGAERAAAVRDLVGLLDLRDLGTHEGLPEGWHLSLEARISALPVDAGLLSGRRTGRLCGLEDAVAVQLEAQEGARPERAPRPAMRPIQLPLSPASGVRRAQVCCTEE
mmetsp:Transcript_29/g.97  ORF Transcript_29/g.97 Transcript_29/m.97 type:complete len:204 (+) Transcript_29:650-1261(+)